MAAHHVRLEMLEEAVGVIRDLWTGEMVSHHGDHYTVENARRSSFPGWGRRPLRQPGDSATGTSPRHRRRSWCNDSRKQVTMALDTAA